MRRSSALILALVSFPTVGQELRGPYVGLGIAQVDYSDTVYRVDFDDKAMSQKLVAGFRFKDTLAVEASIGSSDDFVTDASGNVIPFTSPIGPIGGDVTARVTGSFDVSEIRALSHQGHWVLGIGYFSADADWELNGTSSFFGPFAGRSEVSESGFSVIIGLQWDLGHWGIRTEYTYFDLEAEADASSLGAGFHYRFDSGR